MPNLGLKRRPHILVLESVWDDSDLGANISVVPFLEAWSASTGLRVGFRNYTDRQSLKHWLELFAEAKTNPFVCYIVGHGTGRRLTGTSGGRGINFQNLVYEVFPKRPGRWGHKGTKGILVTACETGGPSTRKAIIDNTNRQLSWIAGYENVIPWWEALLSDMMFLSYFTPHLGKADMKTDDRVRTTKKAETAARWLRERFPFADEMGFGATDR